MERCRRFWNQTCGRSARREVREVAPCAPPLFRRRRVRVCGRRRATWRMCGRRLDLSRRQAEVGGEAFAQARVGQLLHRVDRLEHGALVLGPAGHPEKAVNERASVAFSLSTRGGGGGRRRTAASAASPPRPFRRRILARRSGWSSKSTASPRGSIVEGTSNEPLSTPHSQDFAVKRDVEKQIKF